MVAILSNDDVRALLGVEDCIDALEAAYRGMADGRAASTPRVDLYLPRDGPADWYRFKTMGGATADDALCAVRLDSDLLRFPTVDGTVRREKVTAADDPDLRIGAENGLVLLYDPRTAEPVAILPDGELQRKRVAATSGLAARYLAPDDATTLAQLGTGFQAETQLEALDAVLDPDRVAVYSPTAAHRESFAATFDDRLDAAVTAAPSADAAVRDADVINTSTNALEPVVDPDWVTPGVHVSTIKKEEAPPALLTRVDRVVLNTTDHLDSHRVVVGDDDPRSPGGDAWWAGTDPDAVTGTPLADVVRAGSIDRDPADATLFVNNIGLGVQFAAAGRALLDAAANADRGQELPDEWFRQSL